MSRKQIISQIRKWRIQSSFLREIAFNILRHKPIPYLLVHNNESIAEVLYSRIQHIQIYELMPGEVSRRGDNGLFWATLLAFEGLG